MADATIFNLLLNGVPEKKFPRFDFGPTTALPAEQPRSPGAPFGGKKKMAASPGQAPDLNSASGCGRISPRPVPRH